MKTKNNNEEMELTETTDFLPSDGASCSESCVDVDGMKIACSELIFKLAKPENRKSIQNDDHFWRLIHDFQQVCDGWDERTSPPLIRFN
jgi:hypothetical protein